MNHTLKTTQVFIENQPPQWMLYTGKSSFGADPFAYTDSEEKANHLVRACNSYEAMREALEGLIELYEKPYIWKTNNQSAYKKAKEALTLAEGKE